MSKMSTRMYFLPFFKKKLICISLAIQRVGWTLIQQIKYFHLQKTCNKLAFKCETLYRAGFVYFSWKKNGSLHIHCNIFLFTFLFFWDTEGPHPNKKSRHLHVSVKCTPDTVKGRSDFNNTDSYSQRERSGNV